MRTATMLKIVLSVAVYMVYLCLATEGAAVSSNQIGQRNFNLPNAGPYPPGRGNFNRVPNAADPCPQFRLDCDSTICKEECMNLGFRSGICRADEVRCGEISADKKRCWCRGDFAKSSQFANAGEGSSSNATNSDADNSNSSDSAAKTPRDPQAASTAPGSNATIAAPKAAGANSANLPPASAGSGNTARASNSTSTGKISQ